ncbi:ribulose-phosphate 3-epimerase [Candidatus Deianiraea vastatrix]|uniref:Ribulose-phosphate 3-epimerase n=1 Tax=Candidatus Deianiraea vastatrix TaxID=2163644 RepID=A0A5B8XDW5_9RICK|nr:ribulose-phosphate 3-epimerase [Candidatus Deianiraea vastatrix]QED23065.1 Ribulose-phosphate 3-epimerase [Candidatus Deianiraea vastatrix]
MKVSASILSADFANLASELNLLEKYHADAVHIDVMDGVFVQNLTIGCDVISAMRKYSNLTFDTHLMIANPQPYIEKFANAGSDIITIHQEALGIKTKDVLLKIKSLGKKCGISIKPSTNIAEIEDLLHIVDLILIMTVEPGLGGQKFLENQIEKIVNARQMIDKSGYNIQLSVDGGINDITGKICADIGVNMLVSGSYIFKDLGKNIKILQNL